MQALAWRMAAGTVSVVLTLTACGSAGGAGGKAASTPPPPTTSAPAAVALPFNVVAFLAPGKTGPTPGFSEYGDLDNKTAPPAGPYTVTAGGAKVTFNFPATGSTDKDSLAVSYGQSSPILTVTPGHYKRLYFLAAVAGGPQPANVVLQYQDKTTSTVPVAFDDWCTVEVKGPLVSGTYAAWQGQAVIGQQNGQPATVAKNGYSGSAKGCGLYVSSVAVNAVKTLTAVQLQNNLSSVPAALTGVASVQTSAHSGRIDLIAVTAQ